MNIENKYPAISKNFIFYVHPKGGLFIQLKRKISSEIQNVSVNKSGSRIVSLCNGLHTIKEITNKLADEYDCDDSLQMQKEVTRLLLDLLPNHIWLGDKPSDCISRISGRDDCFMPIGAYLIVTQKCNLRCKYCYVGQHPNDMKSNKIFDILDRMKHFGLKYVIISGGEPFYRKDIFQILDYAYHNFEDIRMHTNGTLLNDKSIRMLSRYENIKIFISLDGKKQYHDSIRGKGSFDETIKNTNALLDHGIYVRFLTVITPENVSHIPYIKQLCRELEIEDSVIGIVMPFGKYSDSKSLLYTRKFIYDYTKYCSQTYSVGQHFSLIPGMPIPGCGGGASGITIGQDGTCYPCVAMQGLGLEQYRMCNILTDDLVEISKKIGNEWAKRPVVPDHDCKSCNLRFVSSCSQCFIFMDAVCKYGKLDRIKGRVMK